MPSPPCTRCYTAFVNRALRHALLGSLAVLTVLVSVLPAWSVCWHRDGSSCAEIDRGGCCERPSAPDSEETCSDCMDIASTPALKSESRALSGVEPIQRLAEAILVQAILDAPAPRGHPVPRGVGRPESASDGIRLSRPLRC